MLLLTPLLILVHGLDSRGFLLEFEMKIEIEFRGKKANKSQPENIDIFSDTQKNDYWVYGMYSTGIDSVTPYIMPHCYTSGLIAISEDEDEDGNLVTEYGTDAYLGGFVLVETDTIGQYTGLLDKNGVKIFEGDILKGFSPSPETAHVVTYHADVYSCGFVAFTVGDVTECIFPWYKGLYVAGNIYDNPELIGV